jgi:HlyD family secretion protein
MKKTKYQQVIVIVFLIVGCVIAVMFSEKQSQKQNQLSQTITPRIATITQKKMMSGNLYPIKEIEVKSAIAGILEEYYIQIEDKVRKGDRIAKIQILSEPSQIENARTNLNTTRIAMEREQLNFEREQMLFEKGIISKYEFEEASKSYHINKEQHEHAKNQLHLLEEGYIPHSNISNIVLATADGTVIDLPLDEGTPVIERNNFRDGSTIALIAQLDSFLFKGKVIENDVLVLKKGMKLTILPTSHENFKAEAFIRKISPKGYLDQGIMKYDIEAVFSLPDSVQIYSGFNATAEFILTEKKDVMAIPEACLIFRNDSTFVEVLCDGEFERIWIETGVSDGINIEVLSNIKENDRIRNR